MTIDATFRARAYVPATLATVARLRDGGTVPAGPAYAVTGALRAEIGEDDQEVLEYAAFAQAAQASLELLRADPAVPRRRVVLAVDAPVTPSAPAEGQAEESAATDLADLPGLDGAPGLDGGPRLDGGPGRDGDQGAEAGTLPPDSARVELQEEVPRTAVAAVHVDEPDAVAEVTAALAEPVPEDGLVEIDHELAWYDPSELDTFGD